MTAHIDHPPGPHLDGAPAGTPDHRLRLLRDMLMIRRFEERCAELYQAAKIRGFLHLYIGEEAVAVGVIGQLGDDDAVIATYREHGHALARGIPAGAVMAEMFGKREGCSRGRGGSMHLFDAARHFYGGNAIVGGGLPLAVGSALTARMRGTRAVTACFFGEGAAAEGEFHESMNLAALWHLPVVFVCENNQYAMGTAIERSEAQTNMALKAAGYGMSAFRVDGMDVEAVESAAKGAVLAAREGTPVFLELMTYRFRAHSMYDPELYRSKDEVAEWKHHDPITLFAERLKKVGQLDDAQLAEIDRDVVAAIDDAVAFAEAGTLEPVSDLTRFVYAETRQ